MCHRWLWSDWNFVRRQTIDLVFSRHEETKWSLKQKINLHWISIIIFVFKLNFEELLIPLVVLYCPVSFSSSFLCSTWFISNTFQINYKHLSTVCPFKQILWQILSITSWQLISQSVKMCIWCCSCLFHSKIQMNVYFTSTLTVLLFQYLKSNFVWQGSSFWIFIYDIIHKSWKWWRHTMWRAVSVL